ncbi:uncharacterized protein LOC142241837 [Haematobia irritans]|uniref:uncharacterized protein LOC142241837 n=1 Tax=Haematobia irritans TaxID=7368 RepID=UPI003F4F66B3
MPIKSIIQKKTLAQQGLEKKTGGGPYDQLMLTVAEEQIVEAAGLTAAVAGLRNVECFGSATNRTCAENENIPTNEKNISGTSESEFSDIEIELPTTSKRRISTKKIDEKHTKIDFVKENIDQLSKLIDIKERSLKIKEETNRKLDKLISLKEQAFKLKQMEFDGSIASKRMDLQIKTLELDALKSNSL